MDEKQQAKEQPVPASEAVDVEAIIALVEARVIDQLTQMIERMAQARAPQSGSGG